jgi:hypothetical protein
MKKNLKFSVVALILSISLVGCEKPHSKIIGTWLCDSKQTAENNKENKDFSEDNPFNEMTLAMLSAVKLIVTENTMSIGMGDELESENYQYQSFEDNIMTINVGDSKNAKIKFLTADSIVLLDETANKPQLVFKKVK